MQRNAVFLIASLIESVMGVSNTSGTYEAYLKNWDKRAYKPFELVPLTLNETKLFGTNTIIILTATNCYVKLVGTYYILTHHIPLPIIVQHIIYLRVLPNMIIR